MPTKATQKKGRGSGGKSENTQGMKGGQTGGGEAAPTTTTRSRGATSAGNTGGGTAVAEAPVAINTPPAGIPAGFNVKGNLTQQQQLWQTLWMLSLKQAGFCQQVFQSLAIGDVRSAADYEGQALVAHTEYNRHIQSML